MESRNREFLHQKIATLFTQATAYHQANQLESAALCYRKVLTSAPNHPDAKHLLGIILADQGKLEDGLKLITQAINHHRKFPPYYLNRGILYNRLKRCQLDLLITVDTAIAYLSGAMNKPTWLLLPFAPDFRWLLDRDDSPWYQSMQLFRQPKTGDWDTVMKRLGKMFRKTPQRCANRRLKMVVCGALWLLISSSSSETHACKSHEVLFLIFKREKFYV